MTLLFNKCCGCIELKLGCFILGYIDLIAASFMFVYAVICVTAGPEAVGAVIKDSDERKAFKIVCGVLLVIEIFDVPLATILVVGLHKDKPSYLKTYVIGSVIFLILYLIRLIMYIAGSSKDPGYIVGNFLSIIIGIYFLLVIRSMYYQMKDPSRGPAIDSAA